MPSEICFEPLRWDSKVIVLRTNLTYRKPVPGRLLRAVQSRLPERRLDVHFRFSRPLEVSGDALALAASTLCGAAFDRIKFAFPVASGTQQAIEAWTKSEVEAQSHVRASDPFLRDVDESELRNKVILNFSGGFDSLASLYLLPENHQLVSLDFGGRFARERQFFKKFDPLVIETNVTETPLRKNSWSFLGLGSILAADSLNAAYCSFGAILESTRLQRNTPYERNSTFPPFAAAGLRNAPVAQGLSEVGTVRVLEHFAPELIAESFSSLAGPREEKQVRKWALVEAFRTFEGLEREPLPTPVYPEEPQYKVGQRFVVDLSALTVAWLGRPDLATRMVSGAENELLPAARELDLGFMLRADKRLYRNYPAPLMARLEEQLRAAGIEWYSPKDEEACEEVRQFVFGLAQSE